MSFSAACIAEPSHTKQDRPDIDFGFFNAPSALTPMESQIRVRQFACCVAF
jgi:hypothetical protein